MRISLTLIHGLLVVVAATGCGGGGSTVETSSTTVSLAPAPAPAPFGIKVEVELAPSGVIRSDIGRHTFGGGISSNTSQLRWTMDQLTDGTKPPVSTKMRDTLQSLNLGTLRFPNGNSSFLYVSENPQQSYLEGARPVDKRDQWDLFLTPDEIIKYTAPSRLNMERLFEVNTVFWLNASDQNGGWGFRYIDDRFNATKGCPSTQPPLCSNHLLSAANKAADWVRRDNGQTQLWEVGNEDWSRLNGTQYAEIFYTFQDKMKGTRPAIKLLAQGLAEQYNGNTPTAWFNALKKKLQDNGKLDSVYAYSIHQYLRTELYANDSPALRRSKQTQNMLADVAEGKPVQDVKELLGTGTATAPTRNWKIWMTEFNVWQPSGQKDEKNNDTVQTLQDMGHALVIADWTGKLLEQNVERLFLFSLDHHPAFAMVQYANLGATIETPRITVPGYAYAIYAQAFGQTMVRNTISGNPVLTAPNGKSYPQLAVYSSVSEDNKSLRVIVINRHLNDAARFSLNTSNIAGGRRLANGRYIHRQLSSPNITDTNAALVQVKWSEPLEAPQKETGLDHLTVAPASANLFILPLQ